jgi:ribonuclease HI
VVLFSRRPIESPHSFTMCGIGLPISNEFKYLGVLFDRGLTWLILRTHFKELERVQWRALRISLGLMQSTHTGTVEVVSGVPPLDLRFSYLNRRFLISAFFKGSETLRWRLQTLADLSSGKRMREFSSVRALGIEPRDSNAQHNFRALLSVPEVFEDMRSALADFPHALHSVASSSCFSFIISERFSGSTRIFTDGSRSEEGTGFGIYAPGQQSFGYRLQEPSGVFTAEIIALLIALHFVGSGQPGEFLILTDNLRSIEGLRSRKISPRTHSIVYGCKKVLWWFRANQFVVRLMWVPTHVVIDSNKMVDRIAKESAASGNLYRGGALVTCAIR